MNNDINEQREFFLGAKARANLSPGKVAELIHPADFSNLLENFLDNFFDINLRRNIAQSNADWEANTAPDMYFWRAVDYYYNSRQPSPDFGWVIREDPTERGAQIRKDRHLRDASLFANKKEIINSTDFTEFSANILFFAGAYNIFRKPEFRGKTFVALSGLGLPRTNKSDFLRKVFIFSSINNHYDGEHTIYSPLTGDDYMITGFCIDHPPLKEEFHGGFFPDSAESFLNDFWVSAAKFGYKNEFQFMPKNIPTESEKKSGNYEPFTRSDEFILDFFRQTKGRVNISTAIIPSAQKIKPKEFLARNQKSAFISLLKENFANLGVLFLVGEVGFEVAAQAGVGYQNWLHLSRWHYGLTRKITDIWEQLGGDYFALKSAAWSSKGIVRAAIIARMKKHPNFNYYLNLNHATNQPDELWSQPLAPQLIGDFAPKQENFANRAMELLPPLKAFFAPVNKTTYAAICLAAPILTAISNEFFGVFGENINLNESFARDQFPYISRNANFSFAWERGMDAVEKIEAKMMKNQQII